MSIADQVKEQLLLLIQQQAWQAGTRLPAERQLAEQLGVSRSSLREAIQSLASQGVLQSRRGDGTFVRQRNTPFLLDGSLKPLAALLAQDSHYRYDLLEARTALEASTAWNAALRATQVDKDRIQRCFDVMLKHQRSGSHEASGHADAQFHLAIAQASHNVVLLRVMHSLFELLHSSVTQSRSLFRLLNQQGIEALTEQHQALMQAIVHGDAPAARNAIESHLAYVAHTVRRFDEDEDRRMRYVRAPEQIKATHLNGT